MKHRQNEESHLPGWALILKELMQEITEAEEEREKAKKKKADGKGEKGDRL